MKSKVKKLEAPRKDTLRTVYYVTAEGVENNRRYWAIMVESCYRYEWTDDPFDATLFSNKEGARRHLSYIEKKIANGYCNITIRETRSR